MAPASIVLNPVDDSFSIKLIFVSNGTGVFSFCNPSRGPTSTIFTASVIAVEKDLHRT
jgi:hypothetical protein